MTDPKDKPPSMADFVESVVHGGALANDDTSGDLTLREFEAIQATKYPTPTRLDVAVTDDGDIQLQNDLGQAYMTLTPKQTEELITLMMKAREHAIRVRKKLGKKTD